MAEEQPYCIEIESPYNVTIQFHMSVTAGVGSEDVLLDEMEGFTIFLFDGGGRFIRTQDVERDYLLANNNTVSLTIDPGAYQMVCWGNARDYSMITNLVPGVSIQDAAIIHTYTEGSKVVVVPDGDSLYYAPRNTVGRSRASAAGGAYTFTVPEQGTVHADIDFTMAHKKLRIYVDKFVGTDTDGIRTTCPDVRVGALTCGYDFLLQPVEGASLTYRNRTVVQTDTRTGTTCPVAGFNTPLFGYDDQLTVDVLNPVDEEVRLSLDLIDELKKQNIDPGGEDIREIRVDITFTETFKAAIKITIPGWSGTPTLPGLN